MNSLITILLSVILGAFVAIFAVTEMSIVEIGLVVVLIIACILVGYIAGAIDALDYFEKKKQKGLRA